MKLNELFDRYNLEHSLLIGYYGGGNYGDELLLEVLANLLDAHGLRHITITYQNPETYHSFHHDFHYHRINMRDARAMFTAIRSNKNIIIGGGGLWGLDVNPNILRLGFLLLASKWLLGKRIYLLGVGYYNSTSRIGHLGAWLAGKSARHIIARDQETFENFSKVSRHVSVDRDMAWHLPSVELAHYKAEVSMLGQSIPIKQKTVFVSLRRFKGEKGAAYTERVAECIANNQDKHFIVAILEPKEIDPDNYEKLRDWQQCYDNIQIIDFSFNPLALALLFKKHHKQLAVIGPQFHLILTAHLANIPFLPIAYDNKVSQLLNQLGYTDTIPITNIPEHTIQKFIDNYYGE